MGRQAATALVLSEGLLQLSLLCLQFSHLSGVACVVAAGLAG